MKIPHETAAEEESHPLSLQRGETMETRLQDTASNPACGHKVNEVSERIKWSFSNELKNNTS